MLQTLLANIGFSTKESAIYLAALQVGLSPASTIAKKAGQNRVTAYGILNEFVKKGLASKHIRGGSAYFSVISPNELLKLQQSKIQQLEQSLPELMGLMHTTGSKPQMLWYDDLQGLKEVYNGILSSSEDFSVFLGTKDIHPDFHHFLEHDFLPRRKQSTIKARAIVSQDNTFYAQYNKKFNDAVVITGEIFDIANEIIIFNHDEVAICLFSPQELSAMVVKSKTFHDCMLSIFNIIFTTNK